MTLQIGAFIFLTVMAVFFFVSAALLEVFSVGMSGKHSVDALVVALVSAVVFVLAGVACPFDVVMR